MYLVEMEHHVVAELAGAEQLSFLGDLEAVGHRDGVEHLAKEPIGGAGNGETLRACCAPTNTCTAITTFLFRKG